MKGPEMMIASLLGLKPDEMRAQVQSALELMKSGAEKAAKIENDLELIKQHLGITETPVEVNLNGTGRRIANGGSNGNRIEL